MFISWRWRRGEGPHHKVGTCIGCDAAIYDDEPSLDFLGLSMHHACYDRDLGLGAASPGDEDRRAA